MEILIQILMYLASICLGVCLLGLMAVAISLIICLVKMVVDFLKGDFKEEETK